jgi:hypothetical protein
MIITLGKGKETPCIKCLSVLITLVLICFKLIIVIWQPDINYFNIEKG